MCATHILNSTGSCLAAWAAILQKLKVVAKAGEVDNPDMGTGYTCNLLDVPSLNLTVRHELEAEIPVEVQRAARVRDRQCEVMYSGDHQGRARRVVWAIL